MFSSSQKSLTGYHVGTNSRVTLKENDLEELFSPKDRIILTKIRRKPGRKSTCNKVGKKMFLTLAKTITMGRPIVVMHNKVNSDTGRVHIQRKRKTTSRVLNVFKTEDPKVYRLETENSLYFLVKISD